MSEYILRLRDIKKSFGGVRALKGVNLDIKKGEIHCLAGENGSGKSTLIKVASGVYTADEGIIEIDGQEFIKVTPPEAIGKGIQVIYQDFSVFPNLTVMENLALNMELANRRKLVSYKRFRSIAEDAVSKINFKVDLDERVENLSIADKQMIAISRALLYDARLIIMDEPTTALTKKEVQALFGIIKKLQVEGISILFVSHKLDEVFEISERFTILRNGENVKTGNTGEMDSKKFAYYMTGREFDEDYYEPVNISDKPILSVKNLSLENGFEDVSFDLRQGEILGITGLLGSGRSELALSLFGIYPAQKGSIFLNGKAVQINSTEDAMNNGLGYVPSDRLTEGLFLPQSINRNIIVSNLEELSGRMDIIDRDRANKEVDRWIENLSIVTTDDIRPVRTLSGGNQQKVVLARWLTRELSVLILNGPTVGVDIGSKYDIHRILRDLADRGLAIIMISDDLPELIMNSNRILIMRNGRIVEEALPHDTTEEQLNELMSLDTHPKAIS